MLKGLSSLLALGSVALAGYQFHLWYEGRHCINPIVYSIGTLDTRFGLSQEGFVSALAEAEDVWERALKGAEWEGKNTELFAYTPKDGKLSVNLIYDYRQEVTDELTVLERAVKTGEARYDNLEAQYNSLKSEYNSSKKSYEEAVRIFNIRSAAYEERVKKWNGGNRGSRSDFESLESERVALDVELRNVRSMETDINALAKEINEVVEKLNTLARELNLNVKEYNTVGASRGETFAGGTYTADETGERIDIFEFENHNKLVRILSHELGHALGLDHIEDPEAIMYYLNEGANERLTDNDLAALKLLCGVK